MLIFLTLKKETPLMHAVKRCSDLNCLNLDVIKFLLENNANVHNKNLCGFTPLRLACHATVVKAYLLAHDAASLEPAYWRSRIPSPCRCLWKYQCAHKNE